MHSRQVDAVAHLRRFRAKSYVSEVFVFWHRIHGTAKNRTTKSRIDEIIGIYFLYRIKIYYKMS